jgi:hypothetical protein
VDAGSVLLVHLRSQDEVLWLGQSLRDLSRAMLAWRQTCFEGISISDSPGHGTVSYRVSEVKKNKPGRFS